jgi:hypothetical protein
MTPTTTIPEDDDFMLVRPGFGPHGINGLEFIPVVAWRIDGPADSGQLIPLTEYEDDEIEPGEVYAIQHPNGDFVFPDGERCTDDDVLEAFKKRCGQIRNNG